MDTYIIYLEIYYCRRATAEYLQKMSTNVVENCD